jgi:hypothetical protein
MIEEEGKKTKENGTKRSFVHMGIDSIQEVPTYSEGSGQSASSFRFFGNYTYVST